MELVVAFAILREGFLLKSPRGLLSERGLKIEKLIEERCGCLHYKNMFVEKYIFGDF